MNHIYRTVWNEITRSFVAVAETVKSHGKRASGKSCTASAEGTVEVLWFILLPVWSEIKVLRQKWPQIKNTQRSRHTALIALSLLILTAIPWSFQIHTQGIMKSAQIFPLIAPAAGELIQPPPPTGTVLRKGELLMRINSPDIESRIAISRARNTAAAWAAQGAALDPELQPRLLVLRRQSETAAATLEADSREAERLAPLAPFDGVVLDVPPDLKNQSWIARHENLGVLIDPDRWRVEAYLDERTVGRVSVGDHALFIPETAGGKSLWLKVEHIDRDASRILPDGILSSSRGGQLPAREKGNQIVPDRAVYRLALRVDASVSMGSITQRGTVVIYGTPTTLLGDVLKTAMGTFIRESGF